MTIKAIASGSTGNAYIVSDGVSFLLIECGINFKELLKGADFALSKAAAVLVSHRHKDHCKSVRDCVRAGLDVYAPGDVFTSNNLGGIHAKVPPNLMGFTVGSFYIVPFDVEHDVPNFGFIVHSNATNERLMYFTDTQYVKYCFNGVTHIMAECNFGEEEIERSVRDKVIPESLKNRIRASHMSLEKLVAFCEANDLSDVKEIYLIHMSKNNSRAERFVEKIGAVTGKKVIAII